jgi:bifunctional DNA-binding transcriptional regulator/antitoxin component of YhaV-PrlF toxin-antitoxin module
MDILWISCHIATMSGKVWRHRITSAGQVSLPAEVRHRWESGFVLIEEVGDHLVVRPAPARAIEGLRGVLSGKARSGISAAEARRLWALEDNAAMERKWREYYGGAKG